MNTLVGLLLGLSFLSAGPVATEAAAAEMAPEEAWMANELPILLEGGTLAPQRRHKRKRPGDQEEKPFSRTVDLPSRGVWFIWLKATNAGDTPVFVTWDLDGDQPLASSRAQLLVQPHARDQWLSYSRYAGYVGFRMQVNVDKPGKHTLTLKHLQGEKLEIDKIALTLYFNARPTPDGKSLDHTGDPGGGRARFAESAMQVDGFREDYESPTVRAKGKTYYVDSVKGKDANTGRTEKQAWKSLSNVNSRKFLPGDAILLARGGSWNEGLAPKGNGRKNAWITVGAYGKGPRPLVRGRSEPGVALLGQNYWEIRDLSVTTNPDGNADTGGIVILSREGPQPRGIRIINCVAFDTSGDGIEVGPDSEKSEGYDGVVIENCLSFANDGDGINIHGMKQNGSRNGVIRACTTHSNDGMAGMWIQCAQNGLIEHCVSYNNAVYNIWTWNSINVTIRYCEAFRGRPPGASDDSGGFDIDWGCEACTLEYCYAHHNKGAGALLMGSGQDEYLGFPKRTQYTVCRYNVFEHNGHGILVYNTFEHGKVYNNVSVSHNPKKPALELWGHSAAKDWAAQAPSDNEFYNNILVGVGGAHPLGVDNAAIPGRNILDYNIYWRTDGKQSLVRWGGDRSDFDEVDLHSWETGRKADRPKTALTSLAELSATSGWEAHGMQGNPGLNALGRGGNGRLPLEQYRMKSGSPANGAGRAVMLDGEWLAARRKFLTNTGAEEFGIPMEPAEAGVDYWGDKLDPAKVSIGAQR